MRRTYQIDRRAYIATALVCLGITLLAPTYPYSKDNTSVLAEILEIPSYRVTQLGEMVPPLIGYVLFCMFLALIFSWIINAIASVVMQHARGPQMHSDANLN